MKQLTPLGVRIEIALIRKRMTNTELAQRVADDTGMFCDCKYICKIKTGERTPPKIIESIRKILEIK
uniref:Uncharacterized protein n=1 Tax=Myoviridae sp. ctuev19 TaxID=2827716 RepID=A0A8S5SFH5_9CAUD|nr:MAG TPA: hypothetical protein [Myoviridae sp. ctuev19]